MTEKSLFIDLGGQPAVDAAVDIFYGKVLADPHIAHYFEDVDMEGQRAKQKRFLAMAFGGPQYPAPSLRKAHAHLEGLDDSHFDAVAGHLAATLDELNVPANLKDQVMTIAASTRDDVLNR